MAVYQVRSAVECTSPGHGCRLRGLRGRAMMDVPAGQIASGQMLGWLDDAVLLLVLALAFPLAILAVGTPIALAVRLLIALGRRWS